MPNAYVIVIVLFILGGIATTAWGWVILGKARQRRRWPQTEGVIESAKRTSDGDDLLPEIVFSYRAGNVFYQCRHEFPGGTAPTPELAASYLNKYPVGAKVRVFYNPTTPQIATIEPGATGDWLILTLGLLATLAGLIMLFT